MNFKQFFPFLEWLPSYPKSWFKSDLAAGLTVAVMFVPQGMAYALLAGMPPIYGLYAGLFPLFLYALFGTSRQLSIGPVAISALLVLGGIQQIAEPLSEEYISLVILTGLLIGLLQMCMSFLRLGFLVNFLSHPVIAGFTSAAAIIIAVSQLKYLLGFEVPRFSALSDTLSYVIQHISETNWLSFLLCIGGIALIIILKKIKKSLPGPLIAVTLSIILVKMLGLEEQGIDIVKEVPKGLPAFILPDWTMENISKVLPTVLTVTIIGVVESIGIAKVLESKHKYYQINANQELFALGISKIGGAFFQSLPTSGSFTRSAVNNESGAKSGMASLITSSVIVLTLVFLTPLFYYLPKAILASIVLLSVLSLFDYKEAIHLWKSHKGDFSMMVVTFIITLVLGIEEGVLAGVIFSILLVMYRNSQPHIAVLGRLPDTDHFRNVTRFPEAIERKDCTIIRFDSQLFFGNALYFKEVIRDLTSQEGDAQKLLILDASSIHDMDSSGMHALEEVYHFLKDRNIQFYLAGVIGPVRDRFYKSGLIDLIGKENLFLKVQDAVNCFNERKVSENDSWTDYAIQTNFNEDEEK